MQMENTAPVVFSVDELWLIRNTCRHEMAQQDRWKFPPTDLDLNDQVAFALDACAESGFPEYTLLLTRHQCLVLDHNIPAEAKDSNGRLLGQPILLKSFKARRLLVEGAVLSADEPEGQPAAEAITRNLKGLRGEE